MGFLSPAWFAGLLAVGLPIYIHLLKRHKTEPVPFSSLMFFEQRTQSSVKHRRLQYLLLLLTRILLIALLVLAFANPFSTRPITASSDQTLVVAVDDSFSMRAVEGTGTRLDAAKQQAQQLLAERAGDGRAQVMAVGALVQLLTGPITDSGELRAAVESIEPADGRAAMGEFVRAIRSLSASSQSRLDVHLFSDLQKSGMPDGFNDLQLPESVRLTLHKIGNPETQNWAVEAVAAPASVQDPDTAQVQVTVTGYGTPPATKTVSLIANGRTLASKQVEIPEQGRATVEFIGLDVPYGYAKGEARVEARDSFPEDDRMLFSVERSDPRRVLVVHEANDTRSPLFVRSALEAGAGGGFQIEPVLAERTSGIDPSRFAFVIVSDVLSLPGPFQNAMRRYVEGGGAALIAVGPNTAKRSEIPVTGDSIRDATYFTRAGERFQTVGSADTLHPSVRRANRWEGLKLFYVARLDPPPGARVIVRLTDQTPLLYERTMGEGRVIVFGSGFDNVSNDFPQMPAFVPFIEQTARYLSGLEERKLAAIVGEALELRSATDRSGSVEILDPDGQRPLSLSEAAEAQTFTVDREGFFEFRRTSGRRELIAVNADRRESNLVQIPEESMELWTGPASEEPAEETAAVGFAEETRETVSYWWYVMMGLLAAALVESVLASRYLGVRQEA